MSEKNAYWKGKTHTDEYKKKMSERQKGRKTPWLYGTPSWNKGKTHSEEHRKNLSKALKGRKIPIETRLKMSMGQKKRVTEGRNKLYKGGIYPQNQKLRKSVEYKLWREAVYKRDNYTCIWCGAKSNVYADHIKPFAYFPELRFSIDNGRTLCDPCHRKTDTWGYGAIRLYRKKKS